MNQEHYRKSSKENFLQRVNSQEMVQSNIGSMNNIQIQNEMKVKQNNIIIDLTNQLYEEEKINLRN